MYEYWRRSIGVLTEEQIGRLRGKTVAVAGVGGVGGLLAERLSRTGIGRLRIADPDIFQPSDMNRQFGCSTETMGRPKAEVIGEVLQPMAPETRIEVAPERVSSENAAEFVRGADLVACEIHAEALDDIVAVCEAGREADVPVIATSLFYGFGAAMCTFVPDGPEPGMLLEYLHWRQQEQEIPGAAATPRPPVSSTAPACAVAAGVASAEILMYLAGVREPEIVMPEVLVVNPKRYRMEVIDLGPFIERCESVFESFSVEA
jgi:molybdopterin/thiamine biosynthesis adenylyltransferase